MTIDVVIPTFNRLWALKRVVPFYLAQHQVASVVVVDDHSTDGTREWLVAEAKKDPRLMILRHETNRGASAARNTGALACRAPYVFLADDDMLFEPTDALSMLVADLEKHSGDLIAPVFIFAENLPRIDLQPQEGVGTQMLSLCTRYTLERRSTSELAAALPSETFETGQAPGVMLVRREVLERVQYDEGLGLTSYRDETDFQLKALSAGYRLLACPGVVLVDMARTGARGGCHSSTGVVGYEWRACRNNWRVLSRHRSAIREKLGVKVPVALMQCAFVMEHMGGRLPRTLAGNLLRRMGLRK